MAALETVRCTRLSNLRMVAGFWLIILLGTGVEALIAASHRLNIKPTYLFRYYGIPALWFCGQAVAEPL